MELLAVAFLVKADDLEDARTGTLAFFDGYQPGHKEQANQLFPDALSSDGTEPPTQFLCYQRRMTDTMYQAIVAYRDARNVPITITVIGESVLDRTGSDQLINNWLAANGLKVIGGK